MNIFKSFCFSLAKKQAGADPKKSALAPPQILNLLRLQQKKTAAPTGSGSATLTISQLY